MCVYLGNQPSQIHPHRGTEYQIYLVTSYLVFLFVCFGSVTAFVPRGQLPKREPTESSSPTQAFKNRTPKIFEFANFGHPVSKSWLDLITGNMGGNDTKIFRLVLGALGMSELIPSHFKVISELL